MYNETLPPMDRMVFNQVATCEELVLAIVSDQCVSQPVGDSHIMSFSRSKTNTIEDNKHGH